MPVLPGAGGGHVYTVTYAFYGTAIADVELGWDKITEIGAYAFFGMSGKANPSRQAMS